MPDGDTRPEIGCYSTVVLFRMSSIVFKVRLEIDILNEKSELMVLGEGDVWCGCIHGVHQPGMIKLFRRSLLRDNIYSKVTPPVWILKCIILDVLYE